MKKNLYYTVEKELQDIDGIEEATGNKVVSVYEIVNNEPKKFFDLDLTNYDNSEEAIQDYLDDNGFEEDEFDFIQL